MGARLAYLAYLWLVAACTAIGYSLALVFVLYFGLQILSWIIFGG